MSDLIEIHWQWYGKDRVYVRTSDGVDVGYVDLRTKAVAIKLAEYQSALEDCMRRWCTPDVAS